MAAIIAFLKTPVRNSRHAEPETVIGLVGFWVVRFVIPVGIITNLIIAVVAVIL